MKILAGVSMEDELYFLEISKKTANHDYFSMSGFTVRPLEYSEDGELWKQAVESGTTELGLTKWVDYVLDNDGDISMIDNSLFPETIESNGKNYIFESGSCGQHQEKDLKEYFLDKETYHELIRIWDKFHLKKVNPKLPEIPFNLRHDENINGIIQIWLEKQSK